MAAILFFFVRADISARLGFGTKQSLGNLKNHFWLLFKPPSEQRTYRKHSKKIPKCISKPNFANQTQMIAISLSKLLYKCLIGSGGDTSGRAMPFCLSRPGSNPWNDGFSFFCSELMSIYSYLALGFFYKCVIEQCILFLLLSCFQLLFTVAKFINCYITILEKGEI